jgi:hypothetical protein
MEYLKKFCALSAGAVQWTRFLPNQESSAICGNWETFLWPSEGNSKSNPKDKGIKKRARTWRVGRCSKKGCDRQTASERICRTRRETLRAAAFL